MVHYGGLGVYQPLGLVFPKTPVKITDGPVKDFAAGEGTMYVVRPDGSLGLLVLIPMVD